MRKGEFFMYKLNNNRLLCESEILEKKAANLESCLKRLDLIESKLSQLDNDEHLTRMVAHIRSKLIEQQNMTRKFSHVFSSAANTAVDSDRRSLMRCTGEGELHTALVSELMGGSGTDIDPTTLPINISVKG